VHAELAGQVPIGGPARADDAGSGLAGQLGREVPDGAGDAVDQNRLAGLQVSVVEQRLPRGQSRDRQGGGGHVVDVRGKRGEVARFDSDVLGE
jgi:hypothetical protein